MCGIIAVLRRPTDRTPPRPDDLWGPLERARQALTTAAGDADLTAGLSAAAEELESVDALLRGTPGIRCLLGDDGAATTATALGRHMDDIAALIDTLEQRLDS